MAAAATAIAVATHRFWGAPGEARRADIAQHRLLQALDALSRAGDVEGATQARHAHAALRDGVCHGRTQD
eukprot:416761-Prorocentrum_lima.AAC.1